MQNKQKAQVFRGGLYRPVQVIDKYGEKLELPDEYVVQVIPLSVLRSNGLVWCDNCNQIVAAGNYCEMCGVKLPK